jgi:hypothetical protein
LKESLLPSLNPSVPRTFSSRLAAFVLRRDTALAEGWLGYAALIVAWRVVERFAGLPTAPFTGSALVKFNVMAWMVLLGLNGVVTLAALGYGLATGNTYRVRSFVALVGACIWSVVIVATFTAPGPRSISWGYVAPLLVSLSCAHILIKRHDYCNDIKSEQARRAVTTAGDPEMGCYPAPAESAVGLSWDGFPAPRSLTLQESIRPSQDSPDVSG